MIGKDYLIEYTYLSFLDRFISLAEGEIDALVRTTTHTLERDVHQVGNTSFHIISFGIFCADNLLFALSSRPTFVVG